MQGAVADKQGAAVKGHQGFVKIVNIHLRRQRCLRRRLADGNRVWHN